HQSPADRASARPPLLEPRRGSDARRERRFAARDCASPFRWHAATPDRALRVAEVPAGRCARETLRGCAPRGSRPPAQRSRPRPATDRGSSLVSSIEQGGLLRSRSCRLNFLIEKYQAVAVTVRLDQLYLVQEPAAARPDRLDRHVGIVGNKRGELQTPAVRLRRADHIEYARPCTPVTRHGPAQYCIALGHERQLPRR